MMNGMNPAQVLPVVAAILIFFAYQSPCSPGTCVTEADTGRAKDSTTWQLPPGVVSTMVGDGRQPIGKPARN